MALIEKGNPEEHIQFSIWKIEEDEAELRSLIRDRGMDLGSVDGIKIESRRLESLAARCALLQLVESYEGLTIYKDEFGKPHANGANIELSISHTKGYAAAAINRRGQVGIDIEHVREKVLRIQHKFLNESEYWAKDRVNPLTQIWAAKEALYKLHGRTQLHFAEQLITDGIQNDKAVGKIIEGDEEKVYQIFQPRLEDLIISIAY